MSDIRSLNCYICVRDIKVSGDDAIAFIHVRDSSGVCEDCLLLAFQHYIEKKREALQLKDFEVKNMLKSNQEPAK